MDLKLKDWWSKAFCKGVRVETIKKELCWQCPVIYECLWTALKKDDRISDHAMFMRAGLAAGKRKEIFNYNSIGFLKKHKDLIVDKAADDVHYGEQTHKNFAGLFNVKRKDTI